MSGPQRRRTDSSVRQDGQETRVFAWGAPRDGAVDRRLREDLSRIREAEIAAERDTAEVRVCGD